MIKRKEKLLTIVVAFVATTSATACRSSENSGATVTSTLNKGTATVRIVQAEEGQDTISATAADIAKLMYPGWNLGNTLEATGSGLACETSWQPIQTSQAMVDCVKAQGFRSVRIPCAWEIHCDSCGRIDPLWIARVKEIVDYCVGAGLYVVLNDHWDNGWIEVLGFTKSKKEFQAVDEETVRTKTARLKELWTQIATAFKDYDEHLLFAGLNEPFQEFSLFHDRHEQLALILVGYNRAFVEAVRATGGNNCRRTLVVQGPSTNIASSCNYMDASLLPEKAGLLMVEVHYYDPGQFCGTFDSSGEKAYYYWGAANHAESHNAAWGEEDYLQAEFGKLKTTYTSKGYPVIIGEYSALQRTLTVGDQQKHDASVKYFYKCVNQYATDNGLIAYAWDTNDTKGLKLERGSSTIIDRAGAKLVGSNAMQGILEGVAAGQWPL